MLREQAQLGSDRLKKPRTGSVWTGWLGSDRLKKLGAGSNKDPSARLDRWEPEGRWTDILLGNIFGSLCRSSFTSIELHVSSLWTCIKVLTKHIVCTQNKASLFSIEFFLFSFSLCLSHSHSVFLHCFSMFSVSIRLVGCVLFQLLHIIFYKCAQRAVLHKPWQFVDTSTFSTSMLT